MNNKPQYREGKEVREEFERTMTALFRAPKPAARKAVEKKPSTARKTKKADKD